MTVEERWVSLDNLATHLGVARDSVHRWIEERGLPAHRVERLFRFKLSKIDYWVRQNNERKKAPNYAQNQSLSKSQTRKSTSKKPSRKRGGNG